jgi:hypothetical protein
LARIKFKRTRIDASKISTPYSLLAVMLLVAEFLFAIWFLKAEGPVERSVAGSIVAAVFVFLMLIVFKMNRISGKEKVTTVQ